MATYNFGASMADFAEIPDSSNPGQTKRPAAGVNIKIRDSKNLTVLSDVVTVLYGYFAFSTTDVPLVDISTDAGSTWRGPLVARESAIETATAGNTAAQALSVATAAEAKAQTALDNVGTGTMRLAAANVCNLPDKLMQHVRVNIPTDALNTDQSLWPDRHVYYFEGTRTGYFNEYGEIRARPGKNSTVALRCFSHPSGTTGDIFQVTNSTQAIQYFTVSQTTTVSKNPITAPNVSGNKFSTGTVAPVTPAIGDAWCDTSGATNAVKVWTGTVWDA